MALEVYVHVTYRIVRI